MKIESYEFGQIVIGGRSYSSDLIVYPDRVVPSWWRKAGHLLQLVDIQDILDAIPDVLIIGTGHSGLMMVAEETINELRDRKIEFHIEKTKKAVEIFNKSQKKKKVVAALHLTC